MRRCPLPEPRTPRKPGYLDRLLETGPARRTAAVRAPHQIRWAPGSAPGAVHGAGAPRWPGRPAQRQARGCAGRIRPSRPGSGQAATAPCRARRPPATAGQRCPRDRSRRDRPGCSRDQAEGAAVRSGAAPGRLAAARAERTGQARVRRARVRRDPAGRVPAKQAGRHPRGSSYAAAGRAVGAYRFGRGPADGAGSSCRAATATGAGRRPAQPPLDPLRPRAGVSRCWTFPSSPTLCARSSAMRWP